MGIMGSHKTLKGTHQSPRLFWMYSVPGRMGALPAIPALKKERQEDQEFKVIPSYITKCGGAKVVPGWGSPPAPGPATVSGCGCTPGLNTALPRLGPVCHCPALSAPLAASDRRGRCCGKTEDRTPGDQEQRQLETRGEAVGRGACGGTPVGTEPHLLGKSGGDRGDSWAWRTRELYWAHLPLP